MLQRVGCANTLKEQSAAECKEPVCVFGSGCFVCLPVSHRCTDGKYSVHACYLCEIKTTLKEKTTPFFLPRGSFSWLHFGERGFSEWLCKAFSYCSPELVEKKLLLPACTEIFICLEPSMCVSRTAKCIPIKEPCLCVCFLLRMRD